MSNRGTIPGWRGAVLVVLLAAANASAFDDLQQRALQQAVDQIAQSIASASAITAVTNVAVLPIWGDEKNFTEEALKSMFARSRYKVFLRSDDEWDRLLKEIAWSVKREDVMDAATLQRFGRIQGVDAVAYGTIWFQKNSRQQLTGRAKLTVHIAAVETGQLVWSSGPVEAFVLANPMDVAERYSGVVVVCVVAILAFLLFAGLYMKTLRHYRPR